MYRLLEENESTTVQANTFIAKAFCNNEACSTLSNMRSAKHSSGLLLNISTYKCILGLWGSHMGSSTCMPHSLGSGTRDTFSSAASSAFMPSTRLIRLDRTLCRMITAPAMRTALGAMPANSEPRPSALMMCLMVLSRVAYSACARTTK